MGPEHYPTPTPYRQCEVGISQIGPSGAIWGRAGERPRTAPQVGARGVQPRQREGVVVREAGQEAHSTAALRRRADLQRRLARVPARADDAHRARLRNGGTVGTELQRWRSVKVRRRPPLILRSSLHGSQQA